VAVQRVKRGDTLRFEGARTDPDGTAVALSGVTVTAEMVSGGARIALPCVVVDAAAGLFEIELGAAAMAALAPGLYAADVQFEDGLGGVVSTETFTVEIVEDVTGAAG